MNDRPMARDDDFELFIRLAFHGNRFLDDRRLPPLALRAIHLRIRRIECLDVQILHVRHVVREAPRDALVVPDHDERRPGQGESLHVPARRRQVNLIPYRRQVQLEVRVVGQQRLSIRRVRAVHDPVVASESLANVASGVVNPPVH